MAGKSKGPTPKQVRFVELILRGGLSQAECYELAYGYKGPRSRSIVRASTLAAYPNVRRMITEGQRKAVEAAVMDSVALVRRWSEAAQVDRNEVVEVRRICCRFCHGEGFRYQSTPAEREMRYAHWQRDAAAAADVVTSDGVKKPGWPAFDELGGVGYDRRKGPHPDCPECHGFGEAFVYLKDTRNLPPAARDIYGGVAIKNGQVEIKLRDRSEAEEKLARHLGLLNAPGQPGAPGVNMFVNGNVTVSEAIPADLDPVEASRRYEKLLPG